MRSPITKLAAAAAIILAALILWQAFGAASKVYALSDAIGLLGQARTIHMRTFVYGGKARWEHWYDIENAKEHIYYEGVYSKTWDSPECNRKPPRPFGVGGLMKVDHIERSVRLNGSCLGNRSFIILSLPSWPEMPPFPRSLTIWIGTRRSARTKSTAV